MKRVGHAARRSPQALEPGPLRLSAERITEIRDAARAAAKPGVYVHEDFIIWNGGQRLAPMLGQAFRLIAYNWANRKQAKRG